MRGQSSYIPRGLRVLLWIARIMATPVVAFVVFMLIGYAVNPQGNPATSNETLLLALFPIGMCGGYMVAWRWPFVGGIISIACVVVFLIALGEADMVGIVSLLGTPGILFLACGLLRRRVSAGAVSS